MERTILFKAKRLDNAEWVNGSLLLSEKGKTCIGTMLDSNEESGSPVCFQCKEVDPSTVCQYTGLKDKEGKNIYEHDLLKLASTYVAEVIYKRGKFQIDDWSELSIDIFGCTNLGSKFDRKEGEK